MSLFNCHFLGSWLILWEFHPVHIQIVHNQKLKGVPAHIFGALSPCSLLFFCILPYQFKLPCSFQTPFSLSSIQWDHQLSFSSLSLQYGLELASRENSELTVGLISVIFPFLGIRVMLLFVTQWLKTRAKTRLRRGTKGTEVKKALILRAMQVPP